MDNIPTVVEIQKYSLPETQLVDSRIQSRLCLQTHQVPTAIEIQTTHVINIDVPEFELVNGVIVKKNKCSKMLNCLKCKNVPKAPFIICFMCIAFLCMVFGNNIRLLSSK
jgi:hypothetical protein